MRRGGLDLRTSKTTHRQILQPRTRLECDSFFSIFAASVEPLMAANVPLSCVLTVMLIANGCIVDSGVKVSGAAASEIRANPLPLVPSGKEPRGVAAARIPDPSRKFSEWSCVELSLHVPSFDLSWSAAAA